MTPTLLILILALVGIVVSFEIYHSKNHGEELVCPLDSNCNTVVHSKYSEFLGARVEALGMLYYAFIFCAYGSLLLSPFSFIPAIMLLIKIVPLVGLLFSIYLIVVQIFILKEWCFWCTLSAFTTIGICLIIFIP
jgi:uncharacterized membrane protein